MNMRCCTLPNHEKMFLHMPFVKGMDVIGQEALKHFNHSKLLIDYVIVHLKDRG